MNDRDVRRALGMPSLSIMIARRRLLLISSILRCNSPAVFALLATSVPGTTHGKLPWVELILGDFRALLSNTGGKLDELGCPVLNASRWFEFIRLFPCAWRSLVNSYHVTTTDVDDDLFRKRGLGPCISKSPRVWACQQCQSIAFRSEKALLSHMRAAHGCRNNLRRFIGPSASCPVCSMIFANRPKALAHVQDGRQKGK